MKLLSWVLFLVLLASSVFAEDFTTSQGIRTLPPLEGLTSENGLRQANSIAEIVLGELAVDAAALEQQETALVDEVAAYEKKRKDEQALLDDPKGPFKVGEKKYLERLAPYEKRKEVHDADALNQRAEALASNSLPATQRDPATVSRLTKWAVEVGNRKASIDGERDSLIEELKVINKIPEAANARLKAIRDPLEARIATLKAKQGLAYRQLKRCAAYARDIQEMLKVKYNKANTHSPVLDLAEERLKALSARGFDAP